jgi:hypothetical protein
MINRHKRTIRMLAVLLVAGLAAACNITTPETTGGPADGGEVELITLERQPCFGFCPVYTLSIRGDGTVEYDGGQNVEVTGPQTATIDPAAVQSLADSMIAAGYLDWENEYLNQDFTDAPYVITSITLADGTTKTINHYHGDQSAPEALTEVEVLIDETANSAQWVGEPQQ